MQIHDELDQGPGEPADSASGAGTGGDAPAPAAAPARPRWRLPSRRLMQAKRLYHQHHRAAWERLGFAVTLALAVGLLSAFGAALLREPHPALLGCRFGGWALVLGLGLGFLLMAKSQLLRAYAVS